MVLNDQNSAAVTAAGVIVHLFTGPAIPGEKLEKSDLSFRDTYLCGKALAGILKGATSHVHAAAM